jgi:transposase
MDIPGLVVPATLCIIELKREDNTVIVHADTCSASARCPWCQQSSSRVHSRYNRTLADLPCSGQRVYWRITARKFYCTNGCCSGKVFAERLDEVARVYGRRTVRQQQALEAIGFALGGEAGSRLATQLGFPVSPDTLLRQIRQAPESALVPPAVLSVDDWAWKRGHSYGTILVDLERHQIIKG